MFRFIIRIACGRIIQVKDTYTVKAILDNGRSAVATWEVKEFQPPVEIVIDAPATVELGTVFGNYYLNGSNKPGNHQTNKGITKKDFAKMSYSERAKMFQENPTLYQALSK